MDELNEEPYADDYDEEWDVEEDHSDLVHPLGALANKTIDQSHVVAKPPTIELQKLSIEVLATPILNEKKNHKDVVDESLLIHLTKKTNMPPAPVVVAVTKASGSDASWEAARRVKYARRQQILAATQKKDMEAAVNRRRHEIRLSNKPIHRALGVADMTPDQHLKISRKKLRAEQQQKEAQMQSTHRWYHVRPYARTHLYNATDSCTKALRSTLRDTHNTRKRHKHQNQHIQAKLRQLNETAKSIVTKSSGVEYVRGSYLLKKNTPL